MPVNPTYDDEIKAIQLLMSIAFPSLIIKTERPEHEDDLYDMLIEDDAEAAMAMRGTYMRERRLPITIQQWVTSRAEARVATEEMERAVNVPVVGARNKIGAIPVWDFSAGEPDLNDDDLQPIMWLKVKDTTTRILPAEDPGSYVAIMDMIVTGWRVTNPNPTDPIITTVDVNSDFS